MFRPSWIKCNQSFYSYVEDISNLICIPLSPEEIINGCIHYAKYPYDDFGFICMECGKEFYLSNNECIKIQKKKIDHCKSHVLYSYEKDISCLECEFRYHMKKNNCYKIYSKIENCDLYEDFYNYEFSCLKTENDKIEKEVNSVNFIFYNNLYIYYSYAYYYTNIILNYLFNSGTTLVLSLSVELLFVLSNTFSCLKP